MAKKNKASKSITPKAGNSQHQQQKSVASAAATGKDAEDAPTTNCPRNLLVTDATQPFTFSFVGRFGIFTSLTVNQTPDDDTWPGGSLWDAGVLLSQLFVALALAGDGGSCTVTTTTRAVGGKAKSTNRIVTLPTRVSEAMSGRIKSMQDAAIIMELGCGVGLTGLVAAAAIGAKVTLLTDLRVVIDRVTEPNVVQNTSTASGAGSSSSSTTTAATTAAVRPRIINKGKGAVVATPLCWGNEADEVAVASLLEILAAAIPANKAQSRRKKKGHASVAEQSTSSSRQPGMPDVILIGDVAYQQTPGAASHFEALLSTLLKFVHDDTIVVFGTRIRMPASVDLLELFLQHFDELVSPPLRADEIDSSLTGVKHNMAIHFLQRKKNIGITNEQKGTTLLAVHAALA
jgi:predicted nicotinamide N-methyase